MIITFLLFSIFLPVLGSAAVFFLPRINDKAAQTILLSIQGFICFISLIGCGIFLKSPVPQTFYLFDRLSFSAIPIPWILYVDTLSIFSLALFFTLSFLIHIYAIKYIAPSSKRRFYVYLGLLSTSISIFLTAAAFVQLYIGWIFISLFSFFLIGFWYDRPAAINAAYKTFILHTIGDMTLLAALGVLVLSAKTFSLPELFTGIPKLSEAYLPLWGIRIPLIPFTAGLLLVSAMSKSAQFALQTWLPDAADTSTAISAFLQSIIASAGIFLVLRFFPFFQETHFLLCAMVIIGFLSAFLGATVALVETNIKKILAFSTISQLGLMLMSIGIMDTSAAFFHLINHAIYKTGLLLAAGLILHACNGQENILHIPKLKFSMPFTYVCFGIGVLSLCAFPFSSSFFSYNPILLSTLHTTLFPPYVLPILTNIFAFCTALYSSRLFFTLFHARNKKKPEHPLTKNPWLSFIPLSIITCLSVILGYALHTYFKTNLSFLKQPTDATLWTVISFSVSLVGFIINGILYTRFPKIAYKTSVQWEKLYLFLKNQWYMNELYTFIFIKPFQAISLFLWQKVDGFFINSLCVEGIVKGAKVISATLLRLQSGHLIYYPAAMLMGVVVLIGYLFFR